VNNTTARQSLPTRATSSASPGISATMAAHPSATRSSSHTRRPNRKTRGIAKEASSALKNRKSSASPARLAPKAMEARITGAISQ
jgi:hypothetical protein